VEPSEISRPQRPLRLAILDDNPFVRHAGGAVAPRSATFHRFAEAVVAVGPFKPARYLVPVRTVETSQDATSAIDAERLHVVETAPFDGIAGYARHAPALVRRNWPVIRAAVEGVDLVWIKVPASNALLTLLAARRARRPFFTWVAGSARAVVRGQQRRGPAAWLAAAGAIVYDGVTRILERSGPSIRLGGSQFTSVVTREEIAATRKRRKARTGGKRKPGAGAEVPIRIVWAGRMVPDKGLDDLFVALASLRAGGVAAELELLGDGPARPRLEAFAAQLGLGDALMWGGHIANRATYMDRLRDADLFVLPSRAEGVPKVVIEAMAAGLPVVATRVGGLPALLGSGPGRLVDPNTPGQLAEAIAGMARDPAERARLREAGLAFAAEHTIDAQAAALVRWMRATFPALPWPPAEGDGR
jgi:glycosyltransferase involved in cell wall biosynthesis